MAWSSRRPDRPTRQRQDHLLGCHLINCGRSAIADREHSYQRRKLLPKSAVPAELLRLAGGALRDHDINEGGAAEAHRLVEGAAQVLRVFDKEALAAEG